MLNFIDELHKKFLRQKFNSNPITNNLRDKIFKIYDEKLAEERLDTANKPITLKHLIIIHPFHCIEQIKFLR